MDFFDRDLAAFFDSLKKHNRERTLEVAPEGSVDLCSNDYLCLSRDAEVIRALKEGIDRYGAGSTASRLIRGHREVFDALDPGAEAADGGLLNHLFGVRALGLFNQLAREQAPSYLSGLLIGPTTTVFYDSGFLIGLKGFVAAVFAGLASYPLALVGALGVGLLESFSSFWASAFKEVIVFGAILPVLLWRSLRDPHAEDD